MSKSASITINNPEDITETLSKIDRNSTLTFIERINAEIEIGRFTMPTNDFDGLKINDSRDLILFNRNGNTSLQEIVEKFDLNLKVSKSINGNSVTSIYKIYTADSIDALREILKSLSRKKENLKCDYFPFIRGSQTVQSAEDDSTPFYYHSAPYTGIIEFESAMVLMVNPEAKLSKFRIVDVIRMLESHHIEYMILGNEYFTLPSDIYRRKKELVQKR